MANANSSISKRVSAPVSPILPDQLAPIVNELNEVSNLGEFLVMFLMRTQESQEGEFSLSFGESAGLINLMQTLFERTVHAAGELTDLRFDLKKEVTSHE